MRRLSNYISNIDSQQPINLTKFFKLIDGFNLPHRRESDDVEALRYKGQLYIVTRINKELMDDLRVLAVDNGDSRASAAIQNRSHSVNVNGSFLLMRDELGDPAVVMIDREGEYRSPIHQSKEALVIENRQNFIDVNQMIEFLEKHTAFRVTPGMNIIFADGNEITNALHKKFLSKYGHLHLCMDVDLGGLTIARNLMSLLPNTAFNFLVPGDIEKRLDTVVQRVDKGYIEDVIKIGLSVPVLAPYSTLIKNKQKVLEQENYLHG